MTPSFSAAVDPIFLEVLGLLERIGRGRSASMQSERLRIRACFDLADGQLGSSPDWDLAKYALACWIDEVLGDASWEHRNTWQEHPLEIDLFNSRERYWKFYVDADQASRLPQRDALETYYVCVVMGFQGLYRPPQTSQEEAFSKENIQRYHLPPDRETWAKQRALAIQIGKDRPVIPENAEPIEGAPPLNGPETIVWPSLVGLMLVTVAVIVGYFLLYSFPGR
jgi:type VI secretion system protein ImpK